MSLCALMDAVAKTANRLGCLGSGSNLRISPSKSSLCGFPLLLGCIFRRRFGPKTRKCREEMLRGSEAGVFLARTAVSAGLETVGHKLSLYSPADLLTGSCRAG